MTNQPPARAGTYVGIPYADHRSDRSGCDCWGLVRLVYRERAGVVLPAYAGDYGDEADTGGVRRLRRGGPRLGNLAGRGGADPAL